jgi:transposase
VPCQLVREYTYAFAAVCPKDGALDSLILPEVNADTMSIFLAEVAQRHPDDFVLMFMDRAGWHVANDLVTPDNIALAHLPPRSPELNPAESLWDEIREKSFPNLVFKSLSGVEDVLEHALASLESDPTLVKSLCGYDWIISVL